MTSKRPLPPGRHGLPRETVQANQRQRLAVGVARALARRGRAKLTVADVVKEAGISRRTFYEQFDNLQEAVLASHQAAADRLLEVIARECQCPDDWASQLQIGLITTLDYAASSPDLARMLTLDPFFFDPALGEKVLLTREHFAAILRRGRDLCSSPVTMPELTEMFLVSAVASMVALRIREGRTGEIRALGPPLLELILIPYFGREEAMRIARVPE